MLLHKCHLGQSSPTEPSVMWKFGALSHGSPELLNSCSVSSRTEELHFNFYFINLNLKLNGPFRFQSIYFLFDTMIL